MIPMRWESFDMRGGFSAVGRWGQAEGLGAGSFWPWLREPGGVESAGAAVAG